MDTNLEAQQLEKISFVGGTSIQLRFEIQDEFGTGIMLSSGTSLTWSLCPYGQPEYSILEKKGIALTGTNIFYVQLGKNDTYPLGGMYMQQVEFRDANGKNYTLFQGIINIIKAIQTI